MKTLYNKPPISSSEHISLLRDRGLTIVDQPRALKYLETIGYFRLSGYMYHLQVNDGSHTFIPGVKFNNIILHYQFDKRLRSLFLEYLERIEVTLRAKLTNKNSLEYGFSWYRNPSLFSDSRVYSFINRIISNSFSNEQERFLKAFRKKYADDHPPSNMAMELLSLGNLSKLFLGLKNSRVKKEIASDFGVPAIFLISWLASITYTRNHCAHHARLWNRMTPLNQPRVPEKRSLKFYGDLPSNFGQSTYGRIAIIERLLRKINPTNSFIPNFMHLLQEFPLVDTKLMGFPDDWKVNPAWRH